jgi:hypothetical protein
LDLLYHLFGEYERASMESVTLFPERADETGKMVKVDTEDAVVANCRIHDSAGDGVRVQWGAFPVFLNNAISDNAFGARNVPAPAPDADLRRTWWGAASGPHHATLNPTGEGNPVGDDILFDPWLTEPPTPATSPGGLSVLLSGPRIASPGSRVSYNILFANRTQQAVSDAVLVAQLPRDGDFAGGSPGATAWGKRKQVFWRSVDLAPGGARAFYVTVGYHWNIPSLT